MVLGCCLEWVGGMYRCGRLAWLVVVYFDSTVLDVMCRESGEGAQTLDGDK